MLKSQPLPSQSFRAARLVAIGFAVLAAIVSTGCQISICRPCFSLNAGVSRHVCRQAVAKEATPQTPAGAEQTTSSARGQAIRVDDVSKRRDPASPIVRPQTLTAEPTAWIEPSSRRPSNRPLPSDPTVVQFVAQSNIDDPVIVEEDDETPATTPAPTNTMIFNFEAAEEPAGADDSYFIETQPADVPTSSSENSLESTNNAESDELMYIPDTIEDLRNVVVLPPVDLELKLSEPAVSQPSATNPAARLTAIPKLSPNNLPPLVKFLPQTLDSESQSLPPYSITIDPISPPSDRRSIDAILEGHRIGRRIDAPADSKTIRR